MLCFGNIKHSVLLVLVLCFLGTTGRASYKVSLSGATHKKDRRIETRKSETSQSPGNFFTKRNYKPKAREVVTPFISQPDFKDFFVYSDLYSRWSCAPSFFLFPYSPGKRGPPAQ
jgi:hypothetical protein